MTNVLVNTMFINIFGSVIGYLDLESKPDVIGYRNHITESLRIYLPQILIVPHRKLHHSC